MTAVALRLAFHQTSEDLWRPSGGWLGLVELPNARLLLDLRLLVSAPLLGVGAMLVGLGLGLEAPDHLLGWIVILHLRGQRSSILGMSSWILELQSLDVGIPCWRPGGRWRANHRLACGSEFGAGDRSSGADVTDSPRGAGVQACGQAPTEDRHHTMFHDLVVYQVAQAQTGLLVLVGVVLLVLFWEQDNLGKQQSSLLKLSPPSHDLQSRGANIPNCWPREGWPGGGWRVNRRMASGLLLRLAAGR